MRDYYNPIKSFCLKWDLPPFWDSNITQANMIREIIKALNAMLNENNEFVNTVNGKILDMQKIIDDFIEMFDTDLANTIEEKLIVWEISGKLTEIINNALFVSKLDKSDFNNYVYDITKEPFNALCDGSDESTLLKNAITFVSNKGGKLYLPKNKTITVNNVRIDNISNIELDFKGFIKRIKGYDSPGTLLWLNNANNVKIESLFFDGTALENGVTEDSSYTNQEEYNHALVLSNCKNIDIGRLYGINVAGDIVYISDNSNNINIEKVEGHADKKIGRNVVSLISCNTIFIGTVLGRNFGHRLMPGGFDIEPNNSSERNHSIYVNNIDLISGGNTPLALLSSHGAFSNNIFIKAVNIVGLSNAGRFLVEITASDVFIDFINVDGSDLNYHGININNTGIKSSNVNINEMYVKNCNSGAYIGFDGQVEKVNIKLDINNMKQNGLNLTGAKNSIIDLDVKNVGDTNSLINISGNNVVENVTIKGNLIKSNGLFCVSTSSSNENIVDLKFIDVDMSGWVDNNVFVGMALGNSIKENCRNLTIKKNYPSGSQTYWKKGDTIIMDNAGETYLYKRISDGNANQLDVDWIAIK